MFVGGAFIILVFQFLSQNPDVATSVALVIVLAVFFIPFWAFRLLWSDERNRKDPLALTLATWCAVFLWFLIHWTMWHPVYNGPFSGPFTKFLILSIPLATAGWLTLNFLHGSVEQFVARRFG
jgi:hypothetical protein